MYLIPECAYTHIESGKCYQSFIDQLSAYQADLFASVDQRIYSMFGFRHLSERQDLDLLKENTKKGRQKQESIQVNLPTSVQSHANEHFKSHSFVSSLQHVGP